MVATVRAIGTRALALLLAGMVGLPLAWGAVSALAAGGDLHAWRDVFTQPVLFKSALLSLTTGLAATLLSLSGTAWLLSHSFPGPHWERVVARLSPLLAVPHAAFAIGLAFLLAPSGWILRALSPWATGFADPPPWLSTQDPWGLGLVVALVAKEVPFLLWTAATQLQRSDTSVLWTRELQLAASLGYAPQRAWWQVVWPQLWPRLWAPVLAVLAYSLTVVDVALVIGPASPPTLSVLAWEWLLDANAEVNARGSAAAWLLALLVAVCAGTLWLVRGIIRTGADSQGRRGRLKPGRSGLPMAFAIVLALYAAVLLALAVGSVAGVWPFPDLWPHTLSWQAWQSVGASSGTLLTTFALGLAAAMSALLWSVAWLECAPPRWDARLGQMLYLPLLLPSVLWVIGVHGLSLAWGWDGLPRGLWLAHSLAALPYVLIALRPAYSGFDSRYSHLAASLGRHRLAFLWRVKWPLLKASLASGAAVGFAVSVAQYLPTLFVGAGRFATVTTEAVTLASGSQRSLTAAYAWLQWLLPVAAFGLAAWLGKPRRFHPGKPALAGDKS